MNHFGQCKLTWWDYSTITSTYNRQAEDSSLLGCFAVLEGMALKIKAHTILQKVSIYLPKNTA
jgi:hypothetical protein